MFTDQVCLVTGGSKGIGHAAAAAIARQGGHVILSARNIDDCEQAAEALRKMGRKADAIAADVTDAQSMQALGAKIAESHGRLNMAFLNAGAISAGPPLHQTPNSEFRAMLDVNMCGLYHSLSTIVPLFSKLGDGAIVVNSAGSGLRGKPGVAAYAGSKWGAIGLSLSAALELAPIGIRLNVIAPGYIATESWLQMLGDQADTLAAKVPLNRLGNPEDVAEVVTWLLSDASRYVVGAVIPVDGGLLAS